MKFFNHFLLSIFGLFISSSFFAQINTTGGLTAQQLASILAGPNITVTNAVLTGGATASGSFAGTNSDIGFDNGVILSTGNINEAPGPNNAGNIGANLNQPGTAQMTSLAGVNTFDAITLEFDFEVQSSTIQFNYVFASEEYPEYAPPNNSSFNDVFAFYISGPGITGEENIALIPNTTNPVAINNINPVTNNQYYVDNSNGTDIQYDGFTTVLEAKKNNLTPCNVYHLKLVIADAGDGVYSSAVFLQENSLIQGTVNVQTETVNADGIALEGCIPASFTFAYDEASNQDRVINFIVGGTAVNGVDYQFVDSSMTIVAGDTSATIYINAFSDGITEGQESVWIIYQPSICAAYDTAYLYIDDAQPIDFTLNGTNLGCFNDNSGEILVNATGGFPPYTYHITDPNNTTSETQSNPITGLPAGTYSVQVYDSYGCQADALVIGGVYDADTTFLPDVPNNQVTTYDAPLPISGFNPGQTINNVSQIQQICLTMEHSYLGDLKIEVEAPSGEIIILKEQNGGASCDLGEPIATAPVDGQASSTLTDPGSGYEYCFNANPTYLTMVNESSNFTRNYTDAQGNNYTDNYLPAGSYTPFESFNGLVGADMNGTWIVHVTDQFALDNGYIFNWYISLVGDLPDTLVTLTQPDEIITSGFVTNSTCGGNDGAINIDIQGAQLPYTVLWSNGATTEDLTNIPAGTYTVTVTDNNGCQSIETFLVNNIGSLAISSTTTPTSCFGGSDGAIDITPSGGQTPYTFTWDSGQTTEDLSGITAGTYTVSMQDQQGCVISESITVNDANEIIISSNAISNEICNTDNGSIDINVTGGTGSYGYQWSNGQATQNISNLTAGTYTIDVVDGNGCTASNSFTIVNDVSNCSAYCYITLEANTINDEDCGSGNGAIDINVLNATGPVTYTWDNGATTEDISNLSAGSYTITVTDANNCSTTATYQVSNNTGNLVISDATISNENCGGNDGGINITVTGGALPYTYSWSDNSTNEDLSNVSAGTYSINVTDGNGCTTSGSYTVTNNTGTLAVTATITPELCISSNGAINQSVSGGNGVITYTWDSGQTTQDITGLSAGTYTCSITDETGCTIVNVYEVTQTTGDISLVGSNITHETCGNGQGAINITVTGTNLTFAWSNGATTEDISGLSAGNYTCTITNAQGCTFTTETFAVINSAGSLNVTTQLVTDEVCNNSNGAININTTGGNTPYTYVWSNGATSEDLINISAGTYTVTVTDNNGCTESHSITVNNNSGTLAIQNAIISNENCGDNAGAIDLIINGGANPISYSWSNGATTQDLTGLSANSYDVTVTDNNGCTVSNTYIVNNQANNLSYTEIITNEICSNGQGSIALTVSGGTGPYTYLWDNGATTASISNLSAGNYSCTITDNTNCSISTTTFTIGNTSTGITSSTIVTDAVCSNNGAIDLTVTGGSNPLSFSWDNGATTEDLTGLAAGTYNYTVTDNNGCQTTGTATVNQTNGNLSSSFTTVDETCGNTTGAIDLTVTGGNNTYTFLWSNGATTEDLSGLSAGSYSCTITDGNGCSITTANISINNNAGTLNITNVIATDETCSNGLGSIDISITGGNAPISYSWSNGATTEDVSNLSSGTYSVVVTDNNGCTTNTQAVINSSAGSMTIVQPVITDENCGNGQGAINITVNNATNPTYIWSNGATTEDLTGLTAGTYSVTVTDANGCTTTGSYIVNNSGSTLAITNANITDEYCGSASGEISINAIGGQAPYTYSWSNGATTSSITSLSAGTYDVTVTDNGGCTVTNSYTVSNNAGNLSLAGVVTDENCGDGTGAIDITTTGGNLPLTFSWDNGATTEDLSSLSANTYTLTVTDNFGCITDYTGVVQNISGGLAVSITSTTDENCGQNDGAIDATITGTGIVSTTWDSGQTTEDISGISAGTYTLTVTNNVGCSATATATVNNNAGTLAISFSNVGDENCLNSQGFIDIEVTGTGPYTYAWSDGQTTQDAVGLSAGTYTVTVTDGLGCSLSQSFTVNNINNTNLSANEIITDAFCTASNGAIDITVAGGISPYSFSWDNGATTEDLTGLSTGSYSVTITDNVNCQVTQTFTVNSQNSGIAYTDIQIQDEFCGQGDGQIDIFTGGTADNYFIDGVNNGGPTITNLSAGTYLLTITDNFGCSVDSTVTVNGGAFFTVSDVSINETCGNSNGSIDITVTGGGGPFSSFTYAWDNGATTEDISGLSAGTYVVTVTSTGGFPCSVDYTVTITNETTFEVTGTTSDDYCQQGNGSIDLTIVSGSGLTYTWDNGATTEDVSGLTAGTYSVTITDPAPGGCTETLTFNVGSSSNGMSASSIVSNANCGNADGAIDLTVINGSGTYTYTWNTNETTEDIANLSAGTYTVTITDQVDNCAMTEDIVVGNDVTLFNGSGIVTDATCATCNDGAIDVTLSTATTYTYSWSDGSATEDLSNLNPGSYTLTATSTEGCDTTMTFEVLNTASISENEMLNVSMNIMPNPANDYFFIEAILPAGENATITITDAVGKVVEEVQVNGMDKVKINSTKYEVGVYFVTLHYKDVSKMKRVVISLK